jgi:hypothetical protein
MPDMNSTATETQRPLAIMDVEQQTFDALIKSVTEAFEQRDAPRMRAALYLMKVFADGMENDRA